MKSIDDVIQGGLCISCGACCVVSASVTVKMKEVSDAGMLFPTALDSSNWGAGSEFGVCPGKGYDILGLGRDLFANASQYDVDFGYWNSHWAARSLNESLIPKASSGGIMTAIADYLLEADFVNGVVASRPIYTETGPRAEPFIARNTADLISAQGSKYCPVPVVEILPEVESFEGRVLFIGTPCQIAGLRLLQKKSRSLREKIPLTLGNYCGGFRDLRETNRLIERSGLRPGNVNEFRYRGGGQPGSMRIQDTGGQVTELPYPGYARMTGIVKHKRCRLCVDATAELADFSCGDAWISRFLNSGKAWSIVMTRSTQADKILEDMLNKGKIELSEISLEEIRLSQEGNLTSKKTRQLARRRLYKWLGIVRPEFDGGYRPINSGLLLEIRVFSTQIVFALLERLRLYPLVAKAVRRYPKENGN